MDLILLRHGKAENGNPEGDFARGLVEKGRAQVRIAGGMLKAANRLPHLVLTSPVLRARQTADLFCEAAGIPGPIIQSWLACGMSASQAMSELYAFKDFESVMVVGHEPDFSQLIEWLLGCGNGGVEMRKGTLACLQIQPPSQRGYLKWLIPPGLVE